MSKEPTFDIWYEIGQRVTAFASDLSPNDAADTLREEFGHRLVEQRWIPVGERMPEKGVGVMGVFPEGGKLRSDVVYWNGFMWWGPDGPVGGVTLWMPKPEPPNEAP